MKLKAIYWKFFNKEKYHNYKILCWIKAAKKYYIKHLCGLCIAFANTRPIYFNLKYFPYSVSEYIKEFNPTYLEAPHSRGYWWFMNDTESRIKALDKLISVYNEKLK